MDNNNIINIVVITVIALCCNLLEGSNISKDNSVFIFRVKVKFTTLHHDITVMVFFYVHLKSHWFNPTKRAVLNTVKSYGIEVSACQHVNIRVILIQDIPLC